MKNTYTQLILSILLLYFNNAISQDYVSKTLSNNQNNSYSLWNLIPTNDKGNLIVLLSYYDISLLKINSLKELEWVKRIEGDYEVYDIIPKAVVQGSDDYYYLLIEDNRDSTQSHYCIIKFREDGEIFWQHQLNTSFEEFRFTELETFNEQGYDYLYVIGRRGICGDPLVLKLDTLANIIWAKEYVTEMASDFISHSLSDKSMIMFSHISNKFFIRKHSESGDVLWSYSYKIDVADYVIPRQIIEAENHGQVTLANLSYGPAIGSFLLMKTDSLGNLVLRKDFSFESYCFANSISKYNSTTWVIAGYYDTGDSQNANDMFMAFIDMNTFNVLYTITTFPPTFAGQAHDEINYAETTDGKIFTYGMGGGGSVISLAITDSLGNAFCNIDSETIIEEEFVSIIKSNAGSSFIPVDISLSMNSPILFMPDLEWNEYINCSTEVDELNTDITVSIYPNPATNTLTINTDLNLKNAQLQIHNAQGALVQQLSIINYPLSIDISQLNSGIYFLSLTNGTEVISKKFVKE